MHDTIKYPDDLLVRVSAHRKAFVCASEATPDYDHVIQPAEWRAWPWEQCSESRDWLLSGRFQDSDDEHWLFLSGTDWFLLPKGDVEVVDRGAEARVPAELM